jgi:carboxypeptidase Taq
MKRPFEKLTELSKTISTYKAMQELLEWDQEVMMPQEAILFRSDQTAQIAGHVHKLKTAKKFGQLLEQAASQEQSSQERAALRAWRRDYDVANKLPSSFVKQFASLHMTSCHIWAKARKENNFSLFAPYLEKTVKLCRKKADYLGYKDHPYDALIDLYEIGMTTHQIAPIFDRLKKSLKALLGTILTKPKVETPFLNQEFSPEIQLQFGKKILKHLGFSSNNSRLDLSTHPFCIGLHPLDTRMTTRIHTNDVMSSIFSVLHEGGHAMYNQGLPVAWAGTPLAEAISLGIDESQSRWWETRIGRNRSFWSFFLPLLQKDFPQLKSATLEPFYKAINRVLPSFIRVEADEVTYNLHIILRFEIEKGLIEGSLKVKEIPEVWNQKMQELLGITPKTDTEGCLQDIHWAMGSLGYFPTYSLGNIYAAQFFAVFEKSHPDWEKRIEKGDFAFIREWLKREIHQFGRQYTPGELIQKVTGKSLDESAYLAYLESKYRD